MKRTGGHRYGCLPLGAQLIVIGGRPCLEQPGRGGQVDGVSPVIGVELADGRGEIVFDRPRGQAERGPDLGIGLPFAAPQQTFNFTSGKSVRPPP